MMNFNSLKILHINIRSIDSETKLAQLIRLIKIHKVNIISLNETFLKPTKQIDIPGFKIFRDDRKDQKGGGSAICIKDDIEVCVIDHFPLKKNENIIGLEIYLENGSKLAIFSMYSSPSTILNDDLLFNIYHIYQNFLIVGDLNCKNKSWYCQKENRNGAILENFLNETSCHILNCKKPTYKSGQSVIDLSICSASVRQFFNSHNVLDHEISDHQPTITNLKNLAPKRKKITIQKIDWTTFESKLLEKELFDKLDTTEDIDSAVISITKDIQNAVNFATKTICFSTKTNNPISIPDHLVKKIKFKRKLLRLKQKGNTEFLTKLFNLVSYNIKKELKEIKEKILNNNFKLLGKFNQSETKAWKLLNKFIEPDKLNENTSSIKIRKDDNSLAVKESEIVNLFGDHLENVFTSEQQHTDTNPIILKKKPDFDQKISRDLFLSTLKNLNTKATTGLDNINNKMLKKCPINLQIRIYKLFNASIKLGHIPSDWKISKIIMIPKKGKPPEQVNSYRPISLISCLSKWLEKIMNIKILTWLEENNHLPPCQSGFRKNMSTHDHFLRLYNSILHGFNNRMNTGVVFFDLEKSFDKISHQAILTKLKKIKINFYLFNWVKSFLSNRRFLISYKSTYSKHFKISSGVPQGSCLSPTLFSVFFSDIAQVIPPQIKKALFADDLSIWYSDKTLKKIEKNLQLAIDAITDYCKKWNLKINLDKTIYTVFTTAGQRINYHNTYHLNLVIDNTPIPIDPSPTFLGHTLDPKLSFKNHLVEMSSKILSKINIIKKIKCLKLNNKTNLCKTIFTSLIRSHFDYLFIAIETSSQKIASDLQKIQNRILKAIRFFPLRTSINSIHSNLKIDLLKSRNEKLFDKYVAKRLTHKQITQDLNEDNNVTEPSLKYTTLFDKFRHSSWSQNVDLD